MRSPSLAFAFLSAALACAHDPAAGAPTPGASSAAGAPPERIVTVEGGAGRLRVSDNAPAGGGRGVPVVFLHGLGSDLEVWRPELDHLRAQGRRAIAYDQRGHAGSDKARDGVYTVPALAQDLEAVRQALGLERFVLVGHSMSGTVLTTYAGQHPDHVAGLVYLDASGDASGLPAAKVAEWVARETAPSFGAADRRAVFEPMLAGGRPSTRAAVLGSLDRMDAPAFGLLRKELLTFQDAKGKLGAYRGPAMAIEVGDEVWPSGAAAVLHLPRTAVHDASHWVQLDQPEAVNRALDAFLATLPAR